MESVNLLVNSNGSVVRSEVVGALKMRAYLSGMVRGWPASVDRFARYHLAANMRHADRAACRTRAPAHT